MGWYDRDCDAYYASQRTLVERPIQSAYFTVHCCVCKEARNIPKYGLRCAEVGVGLWVRGWRKDPNTEYVYCPAHAQK